MRRAGSADSRAWIAGAVAALALLVRTLYLLSIRHAYFFDHLVTEPLRYDAWALEIVRGTAPAHPPFDEGPAYPYLVALVYSLAGHSSFAVATLQALLDAGSCAAIAAFALRVGGPRLAWTAGVLAALYGPTIYFAGQLEPATLCVFAVSLGLWATPVDADAAPRRWLAAGGVWAASLLVRSEILLGLPLVLVHAALVGGRRAVARMAVLPAAILAASLLVNCVSSGHAVLLTTGSGVNLWIGNNATADGVNPFVEGPLATTAQEVEAQTADAVIADGFFRDRAVAFVRGEPGRAARLALRKLLWLWTDRELPNAMDVDWQTRQSWIFFPPVFPLRFGVILPLAALGVALGRSKLPRLVLVFAPVFTGVVVAVAFFTNARFRLVFAPSLLLLAAVGVDGVRQLAAARSKDLRKATVPLAAFLLGVLLSWNDFDGVKAYRIAEIDDNTRALERGAAEGR